MNEPDPIRVDYCWRGTCGASTSGSRIRLFKGRGALECGAPVTVSWASGRRDDRWRVAVVRGMRIIRGRCQVSFRLLVLALIRFSKLGGSVDLRGMEWAALGMKRMQSLIVIFVYNLFVDIFQG